MIIQSLVELYDNMRGDPQYNVPQIGATKQNISMNIVLNPDGSLFEIQDMRVIPEGCKKPVPVKMYVPGGLSSRSSDISPHFLWDEIGYIFGYPGVKNADKKHESFMFLHEMAGKEIRDWRFAVLLDFLHNFSVEDLTESQVEFIEKDLEKKGFAVFSIRGETQYLHDIPECWEWGIRHALNNVAGNPETCSVNGKELPVAVLHSPVKYVGNAPMVSCNIDSFCSYSKKGSKEKIFPISVEVMCKYTIALNDLDNSQTKIGDTTFVFWTEKPVIDSNIFLEIFKEGCIDTSKAQDEHVKKNLKWFFDRLKSGEPIWSDEVLKTKYYVLGMQKNSGRMAVIEFLSGTLGDLWKNASKHVRDISIGDRTPNIYGILYASLPPDMKLSSIGGKADKLFREFLGAILSGRKYPEGYFKEVLRRVALHKTSYGPNVIKGYLCRNFEMEVGEMLDTECTSVGYRLGRMFALMEYAQKAASGVGTIRSKMFSAAMTTPAYIFPQLHRLFSVWLSKIGKENTGKEVWLEKSMGEIMQEVQEIPKFLSVEEQGMFVMGYYHQEKDLYTKKEEK